MRRVKCRILAEDSAGQRLLRDIARKLFDARSIQTIPFPAGQGCGEQYVREHYPGEVKKQRAKVGASSCLMVHIDADTGTVQNRIQQLDQELRKNGLAVRSRPEEIAIIVPRRHTETWLIWCLGGAVDEQYDCKNDPERRFPPWMRQQLEQASADLGHRMYDLTRDNAPNPGDLLPSIEHAILELCRLG